MAPVDEGVLVPGALQLIHINFVAKYKVHSLNRNLLGEGLAALGAAERPLARVRPEVPLQLRLLREALECES